MSTVALPVGYMPLVDAAPLIIAHEMGFDAEESLRLDLVRSPSWSSIRDMLAFGRVEAAHMLSPVPVAMALGLGGMATPLSALMVLSLNGNVIGVSNAIGDELAATGYDFDFTDAAAAGNALVRLGRRLTIGVPFPFSMHAELLYVWLSASGLQAPQEVEIRTVPPPLMAEAIAAGEIDAFCVGEPWGSQSVENGSGRLLLPGCAIWSAAPEKVLAVRTDWAESDPDLCGRMTRAIWRAGRWLADPGSHTATSEILARPEYLDLPPEIIERALKGKFFISPSGEHRHVPNFIEFHAGAATFPWRSQAAWIGDRLAARLGLDRDVAISAAKNVFRSDLYRRYLSDTGAVLPGASEKLEGGIADGTAAASEQGRLLLGENQFFDGRIFDPSLGN